MEMDAARSVVVECSISSGNGNQDSEIRNPGIGHPRTSNLAPIAGSGRPTVHQQQWAKKRATLCEGINYGKTDKRTDGRTGGQTFPLKQRVCIFYELVEQQHNHVLRDIHKKCIKMWIATANNWQTMGKSDKDQYTSSSFAASLGPQSFPTFRLLLPASNGAN